LHSRYSISKTHYCIQVEIDSENKILYYMNYIIGSTSYQSHYDMYAG